MQPAHCFYKKEKTEKMKKVLISLPMSDFSDKEIQKNVNMYRGLLEAKGYTAVSDFKEDFESPAIKDKDLYCLGKRIQKMSVCDAVFFAPDWEKDRMCMAENAVANLFNINILYDGDIK